MEMHIGQTMELFAKNVSLVPVDKVAWVNGAGQKVLQFDGLRSLREILSMLQFTPLTKNVLIMLPEVEGEEYSSNLWQVLEVVKRTPEVHFYIIPPAPIRL